jgi:hypothetical protein
VSPSRFLFVSALLLPAGCFVGSEFPPSADAAEVDQMLTACRFVIRSYEPQEEGSDHLVVNISENEPDHLRKAECLRAEAARRNVSVASVGPLPAKL